MNIMPWKNKLASDWWQGDAGVAPLARLRRQMDQLFEGALGRGWDTLEENFGAMTGWAPTVDVSETDSEITVRAEVPGVDPKELEITVSGRNLTIAGEKKETRENKGENFYHTERRFGTFRRTIALPASVNPDKIKAEDKNGLLFIHLKKDATAIPKRIPVSAKAE